MNQLKHLLGISLLTMGLAACTGSGVLASRADTPTGLPPNAPTDTPFPTPPPLAKSAIASCPVTIPNRSTPRGEQESFQPEHGNGALWAPLGPGGKIVVPSEYVNKDGSIDWKMGWHRGVRGKLTVTGRRLDALSPPAQGHYDNEAYGDRGFQAGWIRFPSAGCWEITGRVADASLTFVTLVVPVPFEYLEPAWGPEGLYPKDREVIDLPNSFRLIYAPLVLDGDQVAWGEGEIVIETRQDTSENAPRYPEAVQQSVVVNGQPGICLHGAWDEQQQEWNAEADAGTLEWAANDFSYRISHTGLGLGCEDLLRVAGASP